MKTTAVLLTLLLPACLCIAQTAAPTTSTAPATTQPASLLKPGDHILFIGDSITGLADREVPTQPKNGGFMPAHPPGPGGGPPQ